MSSLISFSGLASGIDSSALISAMSDASRKQTVTPYQTHANELFETNSVLEELKTKFNELKDLIKPFSTLLGGGISKTAVSSNEAYVGAVASNAALNGTYAVNVTQLAANGSYTYGHSFSSATDVIASSGAGHTSGTVTVEVGTGSEMQTISVGVTADSTTISGFVAQFNEQAAAKGNCATASVVNVGTSASPDYRVMITSSSTGTSKGAVNITSGAGYLDTAVPGGVTSAAKNAIFSLNGISGIERESNQVSDIISGVTFSLQGEGGGGTIVVSDDSKTTESRIEDFVDKFNEIVEFMAENNRITRDESGTEVKNIFGPLAGTTTDETALAGLKDAIAGVKSGISGTAVNVFADLGVTTDRDGTLKFDTAVFESAVANSSPSVNSILQQFADEASLTGGTIDQYTRFNGSFDTSIRSNQTLIDNLNKRISDAEDSIASQENSLRARFARLESIIGKMQSQQQALSGILSSIG